MGNIALIIAILSFLVGGGVLTRFFFYANDQTKRHAIQEYRLNETAEKLRAAETSISELKTAQALTNQILDHVEKKLDKLDLLESVHAKMDIVTKVLENVIPRPEAEAKFKGIEQRVETVESAVFHKD